MYKRELLFHYIGREVGIKLYYTQPEGDNMNRQSTNSKKRKGSCYYTLGRIISAPHAQFAGENVYQTVFVELFGGMRASALAGKQLVLTKGMYV